MVLLRDVSVGHEVVRALRHFVEIFQHRVNIFNYHINEFKIAQAFIITQIRWVSVGQRVERFSKFVEIFLPEAVRILIFFIFLLTIFNN